MKKYLLYFFLLAINYSYILINFDPLEVTYIKYLCALSIRENLPFVFYQLNNLVFIYLNMMEFLLIKNEVEIRVNKKGFLFMILKRCIITFSIILTSNVIMDIIVFNTITFVNCLADTVFSIFVVLIINMLFGKKDYQTIIAIVTICIIRNILMCMILY